MPLPTLFHSHRNLAPLAGLLLLSSYTICSSLIGQVLVEGHYTYFSLTAAHYLGFAFLLVTLAIYFFFRPFFRYALLITLLLGLFNAVNFTPVRVSVGLTVGTTTIGIDPLSLGVLLSYYFLNKKASVFLLRNTLHAFLPQLSPAQFATRQRENIERFKLTFTGKTNEALEQIVAERKVVPAAVTAAQEILRERNNPALALKNH